MTSTTFFIIFIPILAIILLAVNLILAPHNPYQEKDSPFECGFHSFSGQNRTQFSISFFIFALLFLLFDLEIVLIYPYSVSGYNNGIYGLAIMIVFFLVLTGGFIFELGKNALSIDSRQTSTYENEDIPESHAYVEFILIKEGWLHEYSFFNYVLAVYLPIWEKYSFVLGEFINSFLSMDLFSNELFITSFFSTIGLSIAIGSKWNMDDIRRRLANDAERIFEWRIRNGYNDLPLTRLLYKQLYRNSYRPREDQYAYHEFEAWEAGYLDYFNRSKLIQAMRMSNMRNEFIYNDNGITFYTREVNIATNENVPPVVTSRMISIVAFHELYGTI